MVSNKYTLKRVAVYIIGLVILSLGIDLNTKANLGVAPVVSVPYSISVITGYLLGIVTFFYYVFLIFLQILIKKKDFKIWQLLQIPCALLTSAGMQFFDNIIPASKSICTGILFLIGAVFLTAIGAGVVVAMDIVPNPADGLAVAVGELFGKDYGFGKNMVDIISMLIALLFGWIFTRSILAIGIGTVVSMIFIGRIASLFRNIFERIYIWTQNNDQNGGLQNS